MNAQTPFVAEGEALPSPARSIRLVRQVGFLTYGELAQLLQVSTFTLFGWLTSSAGDESPELVALCQCAAHLEQRQETPQVLAASLPRAELVRLLNGLRVRA